MLQAAARIADGQAPYSDFWWFYPPGQPVLLGGAVGGVRAVAAGLEGGAGARRRSGRAARVAARAPRRRAGLGRAAWRGSATTFALAYPSGPHPFPITLALCLGALLCLERPALAGALTGAGGVLAARVRRLPDARGAARLRGAGVALRAPRCATSERRPRSPARCSRRSSHRRSRRRVRAADPLPAARLRRLPVAAVPARLRRAAQHRLAGRLPVGLGREPAAVLPAARARAGARGGAGGGDLTFRRDEWWRVAAAVFALGMLHYLLARADAFHAGPLAVMVAVLAAWAAPALRPGPGLAAAAAVRSRSPALGLRGRGGRRPGLAAAARRRRPALAAGRRRRAGAGGPGARAGGHGARDPVPRPAGRADLRRARGAATS